MHKDRSSRRGKRRASGEAHGLAYRNGSVAMMAALLCASVAALALHAASPLEPVAGILMDRTPVPIAIPLLQLLGPLARPLALWGAATIALNVGGLLALAYPRAEGYPAPPSPLSQREGREPVPARRSPSPARWKRGIGGAKALRPLAALGLLIFLVLGVVPSGNPLVAVVLVVAYAGMLHALTRPARSRPPHPTRVGFLFGGVSSDAAHPSKREVTRRAPPSDPPSLMKKLPLQGGHGSSRRVFLGHNARIIAGTAALIALLYVQPLVHELRTRVAGRPLFDWKTPPPRKPGFDLPGLTPEVTPVGAFYQMDEDLQRPDLDVDTWTLTIEGLVQRPQQLRFADLLRLPRRDQWVTQRCISNTVDGHWMSTALFSGVPLTALLARAGLKPGATAVLFRAPDGHEEAIPLSVALDGRVMLAYAMDGRLLEQVHGFPARALIPGYYGFKSVKWVETMRVTTNPRQGFWEDEGWSPLPEVQTVARIDVARRGPAGLLVAGVAFAGSRGIRAVQVRVDGGPWHDAVLHTPTLSGLTWAQWRLILPPRALPPRGNLTVQARGIDGHGHIQTAQRRFQQPSGATGYHTVTI